MGQGESNDLHAIYINNDSVNVNVFTLKQHEGDGIWKADGMASFNCDIFDDHLLHLFPAHPSLLPHLHSHLTQPRLCLPAGGQVFEAQIRGVGESSYRKREKLVENVNVRCELVTGMAGLHSHLLTHSSQHQVHLPPNYNVLLAMFKAEVSV